MVTLVLTCLGVIPFVTLAFLSRDAMVVGMAMDKLLLNYSGVIWRFWRGLSGVWHYRIRFQRIGLCSRM